MVGGDPGTPGHGYGRLGGRSSRFYVASAVILLAAIFLLQNAQEVTVDFLFASTTAPLIFALLFAFALGFAAGWLVPHLRRRR